MHSAYGLFLMAGDFKGLLKRISPPLPRGKFSWFWDKSRPEVSQEINDPPFCTSQISNLQISSPKGTLADKNSFGDLSKCNCHRVQDFIWRQEKDLVSLSWPLTSGGDVFYSFPFQVWIHYCGRVEVGECGKMDMVSPNKCSSFVTANNRNDSTVLGTVCSGGRDQLLSPLGDTVSSSLLHAFSNRTQI